MVDRDTYLHTFGVVPGVVGEDYGRAVDGSVQEDLGGEGLGCRVEVHAQERALGVLGVGSGERFDLLGLKRAIWVVEALRRGASLRCDVVEGLELPIGPACEVLISEVGNLCDLGDAGINLCACSELGNHQWYSQPLGILVHPPDLILMHLCASKLPKRGLEVFCVPGAVLKADVREDSATIRMLVHDVVR